GADIEAVMEGVGIDKRVGPHFLKAGIGYGGSCFPKDTKSIRAISDHHRLDTSIFDAVININTDQRKWFCQKVDEITLFTLKNKKIAVWGLAFKPNTDDTREAPAIDVVEWLLQEGAEVNVFDPVANVKKIFGNKVKHCRDMYEAVEKAEALLIITEWNQFKNADLKKVRKKMLVSKIVDGRNIFDPKVVKKLGFKYVSMGRP
ncbi:MAG: UDP-glucose 6-dehydrogenase, partial [Candidatus Moranbacteria bacterium CG06_land_8_20_14_3_00_43_56]